MFWDRYAVLTDDQLLKAADDWAEGDRRRTLDILGILIAVDDRDLAGRKGHPTLFRFCTERLRFSEAMAFWRIRSARAAKEFSLVADMLEDGRLNLTTATILSSFLTKENHEELLTAAAGKTRKEVEALIAAMSPGAPKIDRVTKAGPLIIAKAQHPEVSAPPTTEAPSLDIVEAVDAERRRLHFDVGPDTAQLLERAREILRHKYPFASLEDIVREALNVLLDHKDLDRDTQDGPKRETAEDSRHIPMWVRRAVWKRDQGSCAFTADDGRRCGERSWLEFDHVRPYAKGGRGDDPGNVRLLCRAHNQLAARDAFRQS